MLAATFAGALAGAVTAHVSYKMGYQDGVNFMLEAEKLSNAMRGQHGLL